MILCCERGCFHAKKMCCIVQNQYKRGSRLTVPGAHLACACNVLGLSHDPLRVTHHFLALSLSLIFLNTPIYIIKFKKEMLSLESHLLHLNQIVKTQNTGIKMKCVLWASDVSVGFLSPVLLRILLSK